MKLFVLTRLIFDGRRFERCEPIRIKKSLESAKLEAQNDFDENFLFTNGGEKLELTWHGNSESDRDLVAYAVVSQLCDPVYWEIHEVEYDD